MCTVHGKTVYISKTVPTNLPQPPGIVGRITGVNSLVATLAESLGRFARVLRERSQSRNTEVNFPGELGVAIQLRHSTCWSLLAPDRRRTGEPADPRAGRQETTL